MMVHKYIENDVPIEQHKSNYADMVHSNTVYILQRQSNGFQSDGFPCFTVSIRYERCCKRWLQWIGQLPDAIVGI